ncbi:MAG TPA: hypothetical protein VJ826_09390 [Candidatus Polarisedimenticolaceae bacterium]|nr:hypothetical protein [Candidatus Polarisedimenticolaceae bacterium]
MRRPLILACAFALSLTARAETFSKAYEFKPNTVLKVGADVGNGVRLDSVEFVMSTDDGSPSGLFAGPKVKVTVSNLSDGSRKIGLAIAVADAENRLVAVASGGTKLFPLRTGRQIVYTLDIDGVMNELAHGTAFRISVEPRP